MPEWQRLVMQGAVMVVTATLVVAVSAWWSGGKQPAANRDESTKPSQPAPLFATTNKDAATSKGQPADPSTATGNAASVHTATGGPVLGNSLNGNVPTGQAPAVVASKLGGPQPSTSLNMNATNPAAMGQAPANSMDEDAPYTMAPVRPTAYPSTSPQRYQYPTTNPEAGPGVVPASAGDSFPRVGENLPASSGAPR
jgi:hypothetical protein